MLVANLLGLNLAHLYCVGLDLQTTRYLEREVEQWVWQTCQRW